VEEAAFAEAGEEVATAGDASAEVEAEVEAGQSGLASHLAACPAGVPGEGADWEIDVAAVGVAVAVAVLAVLATAVAFVDEWVTVAAEVGEEGSAVALLAVTPLPDRDQGSLSVCALS